MAARRDTSIPNLHPARPTPDCLETNATDICLSDFHLSGDNCKSDKQHTRRPRSPTPKLISKFPHFASKNCRGDMSYHMSRHVRICHTLTVFPLQFTCRHVAVVLPPKTRGGRIDPPPPEVCLVLYQFVEIRPCWHFDFLQTSSRLCLPLVALPCVFHEKQERLMWHMIPMGPFKHSRCWWFKCH